MQELSVLGEYRANLWTSSCQFLPRTVALIDYVPKTPDQRFPDHAFQNLAPHFTHRGNSRYQICIAPQFRAGTCHGRNLQCVSEQRVAMVSEPQTSAAARAPPPRAAASLAAHERGRRRGRRAETTPHREGRLITGEFVTGSLSSDGDL